VITGTIQSGNYQVQVSNAVGDTQPLSLTVNWNAGTPTWNSGGSLAGGIVTLYNGGGFPSSIDGLIFSVALTAGSQTYPINVVSCCNGNNISLLIPPTTVATLFTLTFKGPVNTLTKTYFTDPSLTPTGTITSPANLTVGANTISFTVSSSSATITSIQLAPVVNSNFALTVPINSWTTNGSSTNFTITLTTGSYNLLVNTANGYIAFQSNINVVFPTNAVTDYTGNSQQTSFNGGTFTIAASSLAPFSYITINGFVGKILSYSTSSVTYAVPALVTTATQTAFSIAQSALLPGSLFTFFSDQNASASNVSASFDGIVTTFYGSNNSPCYIGLDAGSGLQVSVSTINFFPNIQWPIAMYYILYASFQGSNDNTTWNNLAVIDQTVHTGWNVIKSTDNTPYRYIRFLHNSTSMCNIAEIQLYGILYSNINVNLASQTANVIYNDGFNAQVLVNAISYQQSSTPVVTSINPRYGDIYGGYTLTLTGTNLNSGNQMITIDGVSCPVTASNTTSISCTVAARPNLPTINNNFTVTIGGSNAILRDTFLYVLKWSNPKTWGVGMPPIANDLIYVPLGTTLLVDVNTPVLNGIAVNGGTLIFSDDMDLVVQTGFITVNGGTFIAGTQAFPHSHQLTFILYGNYYGAQQPMFGNKGIGCMNCKFSMYGTPRIKTWTSLAATVNVGDTSFTVLDAIDWKVGEQIVVASTSFDHNEAEQMTITAVSNKTVTVSTPFVNKHVSQIEPYGAKFLVMQA
jgi:hypothetical protein